MKSLLFLSPTILWCAAGAAIAGEYHVAQKSLAADDKNPGTADKPFKTINAAVAGARLKSGDTLYVHEGVYREAVELSGANAEQGQPGAHIRILAWPKDVVEIKGSDVVTDWKQHEGGTPATATATAPADRPAPSAKLACRGHEELLQRHGHQWLRGGGQRRKPRHLV
jgi:hypothetical protein